MKLTGLLLAAITFASFSLSARTVQTVKNFKTNVEASNKAELADAINAAMPMIKMGESADPFGCAPVTPANVTVNNITVHEQFSVGSNGELTPYVKATIHYSQVFNCHDGGR